MAEIILDMQWVSDQAEYAWEFSFIKAHYV